MKQYRSNLSLTSKAGGFSLVELMVVVAILGIMAAFANESYQEHIKKTRRLDAQTSLAAFALALERHFSTRQTYEGVSASSGVPQTNAVPLARIFPSEAPLEGQKFYDLRVSYTATSFTVSAIPKTGTAMQGDGNITLTNTGVETWSPGGVAHDWDGIPK